MPTWKWRERLNSYIFFFDGASKGNPGEAGVGGIIFISMAIRLNKNEFWKWRERLNSYIFFFDGASKGNPREAGAGGIIFDSDGNKVHSFTWRLGKKTNN